MRRIFYAMLYCTAVSQSDAMSNKNINLDAKQLQCLCSFDLHGYDDQEKCARIVAMMLSKYPKVCRKISVAAEIFPYIESISFTHDPHGDSAMTFIDMINFYVSHIDGKELLDLIKCYNGVYADYIVHRVVECYRGTLDAESVLKIQRYLSNENDMFKLRKMISDDDFLLEFLVSSGDVSAKNVADTIDCFSGEANIQKLMGLIKVDEDGFSEEDILDLLTTEDPFTFSRTERKSCNKIAKVLIDTYPQCFSDLSKICTFIGCVSDEEIKKTLLRSFCERDDFLIELDYSDAVKILNSVCDKETRSIFANTLMLAMLDDSAKLSEAIGITEKMSVISIIAGDISDIYRGYIKEIVNGYLDAKNKEMSEKADVSNEPYESMDHLKYEFRKIAVFFKYNHYPYALGNSRSRIGSGHNNVDRNNIMVELILEWLSAHAEVCSPELGETLFLEIESAIPEKLMSKAMAVRWAINKSATMDEFRFGSSALFCAHERMMQVEAAGLVVGYRGEFSLEDASIILRYISDETLIRDIVSRVDLGCVNSPSASVSALTKYAGSEKSGLIKKYLEERWEREHK